MPREPVRHVGETNVGAIALDGKRKGAVDEGMRPYRDG